MHLMSIGNLFQIDAPGDTPWNWRSRNRINTVSVEMGRNQINTVSVEIGSREIYHET